MSDGECALEFREGWEVVLVEFELDEFLHLLIEYKYV